MHPAQAIVYARVSTDEQDTVRQDRMLDEYCQRHQLEIVTRLEDPAVSGSVPFCEREGARELLAILAAVYAEQVKAGPIPDDQPPLIHIVTTESDRIGRDLIDTVGTIRRFWTSHALPHFTAEGGAFPRTPTNELVLGTRASAAQFERDIIRSRIRSRLHGKRAAGELCGTVPFGWDAVPTGERTVKDVPVHRLVPNLTEQRWLRVMAAMRAGGSSYHAIAKHLNSAGVLTKRAGQIINDKPVSAKWQSGNVANVLSSSYTRQFLRTPDDESGSSPAVNAA